MLSVGAIRFEDRFCASRKGGTGEVGSLVPRPLPDFILQPWRKIGRRPGTITTSQTGNGGLDSYVMWTRFHNDGNVPTQYAASTPSDRTVKFV